MATRYLTRAVLSATKPLTGIISHSYSSAVSFSGIVSRPSFIIRLRPLVAASPASYSRLLAPAISTRGFATRPTASSLNDQNPNWSNRPPKETILLDGCDFEHWLVVVEPPPENATRDEIIDSYIKTLATVVGSEEEARMKIYSVSTRCYFAFGALVSEELSYKIKELPNVRWVLPDSYLDVKNKDYGGEPFINGQAVPYDPKYHEEWIRNNSRANERNRRNDRPRNFDRSRNFERRREMNNYQNTGGSNMGPPQNFSGPPPSNATPPFNAPPPSNTPPPFNAPPPSNTPPPFNAPPPSNAPNAGGPNGGYGNYGGMPPSNTNPGSFQPRGPPPPPPGNNTPNYQYGPSGGPQGGFGHGMGPGQVQHQNNAYAPQNMGGGNHYPGQNAPPQPPNRGFSQGNNSGGFGPGPNQNSYGQNHNGYGPQGSNHGGYGNPPQSQNVPGRDSVN